MVLLDDGSPDGDSCKQCSVGRRGRAVARYATQMAGRPEAGQGKMRWAALHDVRAGTHHTGEGVDGWLRSGLGSGRGGWSASMRIAAARTVHAGSGRAGWARGGARGTMGLHLVSGWWCRGCRGLHGEGARWRRIGRDEVTSCGKCILQAGRCNAGVGRASSFGPFLDRIGSSGTGLHSNLLRSRQASGPMAVQKRHADRKHGPASHGTKEPEPHSAGRRGQGLGSSSGTRGAWQQLLCSGLHAVVPQLCRSAGRSTGSFFPQARATLPHATADEEQSTAEPEHHQSCPPGLQGPAAW